MQNTQLNSGQIADFIPIGQDGQPIYLNADAFRDALALNPMVGEKRVNHLAVPRIRAAQDIIDWYVPFPPQSPDGRYHVVTWNSATAQERQEALRQLHDFELSLKRLGQDLMRRSGDRKSMLLARYLTGQNSAQNLPAIHFPSPDYVYIVDGIAVITFWGFCSKGANLGQSPFVALNQVPPAAPATAATASAAAASPLNGAMPPPPPPPQDTGPESAQTRHHCIIPSWLLKLLSAILILLLLLLLLWWLLPKLFNWGDSSSTSIFDSAVDPAISTPYEENTDQGAASEGDSSAGSGITTDQGLLLDNVPDKVEEVQDVTKPEEVQELLEAPVVDSTNHEVQLSPEDSAAPTVHEVLVPVESESVSTLLPENGLAGESVPNVSIGATPVESGNVLDLGSEAQAVAPGLTPEQSLLAPNAAGAVPMPVGTDGSVPVDAGGNAPVRADGSVPVSADGGVPSSALPPDPLANMQQQPQQALSPEQQAQLQKELAVQEARLAEQVSSGNLTAEQAAAMLKQMQVAAGVPSAQPLSFTPQVLSQRGVRVFNGNWNTRSGLMDSANGRPLQLGYELEQGKGRAVVTRPDGMRCVTDVSATASGSVLSINAAGRAICPDQSTYQVPEVRCALNGSGQVECFGYYGQQRFPIQFYQQ